MSGVEALGLLLGVVPLLISAIEHYDDVLRPIHAYRKFNSKSQMLCDEYGTERTIFQTECQLLLGEFVGLKTAQEMLTDPSHPLWRDEYFYRTFEGRLGNLGATCRLNFSKIKGKLREMHETFEGFEPDIVQPSDVSLPYLDHGLSEKIVYLTYIYPKVKSSAYKQWLRVRKKKLKFAFSEGTLRDSISELRNQNHIFRVISGQIIRFDRQHSENNQKRSVLSFSKRLRLRQFEMIRTASSKLYEALCSACSAHRDHLAKFSLKATYAEPRTEIGHSLIYFDLAYAPIPFSQSRNASREREKRQPCPVSSTAKNPEVLYSLASESFAEAMWFEVQSTGRFWKTGNTEQTYRAITENSSYDGTDDLCFALKTTFNPHSKGVKNLVSFLNNTQSCRHHIYYPSDYMPPSLRRNNTSLTELLSANSGHPIGNIPQLHRLRIARSLMTAVLQFHATPWLTESWQSKTLLFNYVNPENWQSYNPSPHLMVHIAAAKKEGPESGTITRPSLALAAVVPNLMLFNLGIMLLELAYGAPFLSLLQSPSVAALADPLLTDYNAAYHLASNVGVFLGSEYAEIVRKCLRCDFGEGEDLNKPALKERLYEDVFCRLERMEDGIRKSQGEI